MQKAVTLLVCLSLWTALALTAASKSFSSRELLSAVMFSFPVSVCYSCFLDSPLRCSSKTRLKLRRQTFNQHISIFLKFLKFPGDKWRCHQSLQLQSQVSANTSSHPQNLPLALFVPVFVHVLHHSSQVSISQRTDLHFYFEEAEAKTLPSAVSVAQQQEPSRGNVCSPTASLSTGSCFHSEFTLKPLLTKCTCWHSVSDCLCMFRHTLCHSYTMCF